MPNSKIFARQILGSQAFIEVVRSPSSDPAVWLLDPRRGGIAQSGVVISAATVQQALYRARVLGASPHARMRAEANRLGYEIERGVRMFSDARCILAIETDHVMLANRLTDEDLVYANDMGANNQVNILERIVIATAICGLEDRKLELLDYDQPGAFPILRSKYRIKIGTWKRSLSSCTGTGP